MEYDATLARVIANGVMVVSAKHVSIFPGSNIAAAAAVAAASTN